MATSSLNPKRGRFNTESRFWLMCLLASCVREPRVHQVALEPIDVKVTVEVRVTPQEAAEEPGGEEAADGED